MKYLSPKQLGRAIGVSESSLKRWIDGGEIAVTRTAGGHRRIELSEAVRFVRMRGYVVSDPKALGLSAADEQDGRADDQERADRLFDLLNRGKDVEFRAAFTRLYLDGHPLHALIDGPFRMAMARIGELWHANPDGIGIEHRATDISIRTLGYLHTLIKPVTHDAPLAVGGAPSGDLHLLSSLCIALVLAEQGWREVNLGANTPWDQFVAVSQRERATLCWLSLTAQPPAGLPGRVTTLADQLNPLGCQLVIGGLQVDDAMARLSRPNLHAAGAMAELVGFARGLLVAHRG